MKKLLMAAVLALLAVSTAKAASTVTATGGVTVSTTGWHSTGEAVVLRLRPNECLTYSYGGTTPRGILLFQYSKDRSNWVTMASSTTLGGMTTTTGSKCSQDESVNQNTVTFYRLYVSSYTSGSYALSLADSDDLVTERKNNKGITIDTINDDSRVINGNLSVTGTLTQTGAVTQVGAVTQSGGAVTQSTTTFTGGFVPWQLTLAQINALTSSTTGQIVGCSDCVMVGPGGPCKSSGTVTAGAWTVLQATAAAPTTPLHCQ